MSKTVPTALAEALSEDLTTLTTIWTITRQDGVTVRLTELDRDIVIDGDRWVGTFGYSRTAIAAREGLEADDVELQGLIDEAYIDEGDVRVGLYDGASLSISLVDYESPEFGTVVLKRGTLGAIILSGSSRYSAELRSLTSRLSQEIIEKTSPTCRAELGDSRCTVPLGPTERSDSTSYELGDFVRVATTTGTGDQVYQNRIYECTTAGTTDSSEPTFSTTLGGTTTDGTAVWTARAAWTVTAIVASVTDRRIFTVTVSEDRAVDDWFNLGTANFQSGDNINQSYEVKDWIRSSNTVVLFLPAGRVIQVGDALTLVPGCDKLRATCAAKFALSGTRDYATGNVLNFRGEPDLPGRDAVLAYPDAQ